MSRQNRRTKPTRANLGGEKRRNQRISLRATARFALHEVKAVRRIRRKFLQGKLSARQRIIAHRHRGERGESIKGYFRAGHITPV